MRERLVQLCLAFFCVLAVVSVGHGASAQSTGRFDNTTSFDFENFQPMPAQGVNILNVATSDVLPANTPSVGLFVHYQENPLVVLDPLSDETTSRLIDSQLKAEVWAAYGIGDVFDFGIVVPFVVYQNTGDFDLFGQPGTQMDGGALSDIRMVPKFRLLDPEEAAGVGIALAAPIALPFGDTQSFNSDGAIRPEPTVVLDYRHPVGVHVSGNVGYQFRPRRTAQNFVSNDILRWRFGARVPSGLEFMTIIGSVFGSYKFEEDRSLDNFVTPAEDNRGDTVEALGGLEFSLPHQLVANVGAGAGLNNGIGSPDVRIFASIGYTPTRRDDDGDGIDNHVDQCVDDPEDMDGFEDQDGCPDPDNDDDGVADEDDECPNAAEDLDGFEDQDGCPDTDNDGDGIADADDECPDAAEDVDGFQDEDGCPDEDNDEDGVLDVDDECPDTPGVEGASGCEPRDSDGDGISDHLDECPNTPEDLDGFEDDDGCPDPDNDGDGILDEDDACPNEKEVINGVDDEDGCPDDGESKVEVTEEKIEILEKVYFDVGEATIRQRSFNLLDQVASVLRANRDITRVRIEGHTDSQGDDTYNKRLSQERADAVKDYLVEAGISAQRLEAKGYGEEKPIADNETSEGRTKNRRVEFSIVERDGFSDSTDAPEQVEGEQDEE